VRIGEDVPVARHDDAAAQAALAGWRSGDGASCPKNLRNNSSGMPVGSAPAFFSTRTVTTPGATRATASAYDVTA
jgi:hypothetical protein